MARRSVDGSIMICDQIIPMGMDGAASLDGQRKQRDTRILGWFRTASALWLLGASPFSLVFFSRAMPVCIGLALLILLIGHMATGFRHVNREQNRRTLDLRRWSTPALALLISYSLLVLWITASLLWTPVPHKAFPEIIVVFVMGAVTSILVNEYVHVPVRVFAFGLRFCITVTALLVLSELNGWTRLHNVFDKDAVLYDLNRNAVLLVLLLCTVPLFWRRSGNWRFFDFIPLFLVAAVQVFTQSQSAQIAFVGIVFGGIALRTIPMFLPFVFGGIATTILAFPFLVGWIEKLVAGSQNPLFVRGHAEHRLHIWANYRDHIMEKPWIGWGIEGDRYLGELGFEMPLKFGTTVLNPHNFVLETWVNYGFVGAALGALTVLCLGWVLTRMTRRERTIAAQIVIGCTIYMLTGSSMMQGWWVATVILAVCVFLTGAKKLQEHAIRQRGEQGKAPPS